MRYLAALLLVFQIAAEAGGELRFTLRADPKTLNPLLVSDEASEQIRYLTGGFLIRVNRLTQQLEPELATKWKVSEGGRRIDFDLRSGVLFSDGTPFSCEDVAFTIRQLMDPALHSPSGDAFRSGPGAVETGCTGRDSAMARFPAPVAALAWQFDQVAIISSKSPSSKSPRMEAAVLGAFQIAENKPGAYILLRRNPNYWKRDKDGHRLPYLDSIRLDIQQNRETELLRFRRGQLDLVNKIDPELFDRLATELPNQVVDAGPSLDWELVFFNQVPNAPLPEYKKVWFRSPGFRHAISEAINREDLCRIVYRGHARPAAGPISPANRFWVNSVVQPHRYSVDSAMRRLAQEGFRRNGSTLSDRDGHAVEFSMITNSGNKLHERALALIQQDLAKIGVHLNVLTLDFPSLVERISRSFDYESCLMAFANIDLDPNEQMNIWLSSAANHQWNPNQKTPATPWEAEVDKLIQTQNAAQDNQKRKAAFDRVQEILSEQVPFIYLVYPNSLFAVSPHVKNAKPASMRPQLYWNADRLDIAQHSPERSGAQASATQPSPNKR
jgi:peptide/nickel transport system substrate-binding protein